MAKLFSGRPTPGQVGLFLFLWLFVGFASGTVTLLGPVRWLTGYVRQAGWGDAIENGLVIGLIGIYVAASFLLSVVLTRTVLASRRWSVRLTLPAAVMATAAGAMWLWMTPALVNSFQPVEVTTLAQFTFGPYPERERFASLQQEGYTGVVSLLSPTLPFEAVLFAREREVAQEFDLELIHAPMLPWVSGNEASLTKIRALIDDTGGRYYVHCYLGRDRTGMVQRLVQRSTPETRVVATPHEFRLREGSSFKRGSFERGEILEVDADVYLTPFPTDDEMLKYFVAADVAHVVSLLDPRNPDDVKLIDKEESVLAQYEVSYHNSPVSWLHYDPESAVAAAEHVRRSPRPVLVHAFRSSGLASSAFRLAYASGLPPIPRSLFEEPMQGGVAQVAGINIVIGPRPAASEFGAYLFDRGIRGLVYIGDARRRDAIEDRARVEVATPMAWQAFLPGDARLFETLSAAGPWYVYGPAIGVVQGRIEDRFLPQRYAIESATAAPAVAAGQ